MKSIFYLYLLAEMLLLFSCNGNPEHLKGGKKRKKKAVSFFTDKNKYLKPVTKTGFLGNLDTNKIRLLFMPAKLKLQKRYSIGVVYLKGEKAEKNLNLLSMADKVDGKGCQVEWVLHFWSGKKYNKINIMSSCNKFEFNDSVYKLSGTPQKVVATLITKLRIQPDRKLAVLKVPVVHVPNTVKKLIGSFVEEVVPANYDLQRLPSFKVSTERFAPMPKDLSKVDTEVRKLRNRLKYRLNVFSERIKRKAPLIIKKIIPPYRIKERFGEELYAKWGITVLCTMGTNADRMYSLAATKKVWLYSINIPSFYDLVVVKFPKNHPGPTLYERISGLTIEPPIEFK